MAFNNIYARLAEGTVNAPSLLHGRVESYGTIQIPKVNAKSERGRIVSAVLTLTQAEQHAIIDNQDTRFFLYRCPEWRYVDNAQVPRPQVMNGVLNMTYSIATNQYIWTPIDPIYYNRYIAAPAQPDRSELIRQISLVLYTIRNNTFHGGKEAGDENAQEVLDHAYSLLRQIVDFHLPLAGLP